MRLIKPAPSYARMANRAFDKIRQNARGMPAVLIHMIDAITSIIEETRAAEQRQILVRQAEMIARSAEESVIEPNDLCDIVTRYRNLLDKAGVDDPGVVPEASPAP